MLRQTEDQVTSTRLRPRRPTIRGAIHAALASTVLLAAPAALAHGGHHLVASAQATSARPLGGVESKSIGNPLVEKVRDVNARFADVNTATAEGYAAIPCVSGPGGGAMGIHYVNGALIEDGLVDISKPEAVMYEPQPDGSMQLVAVEYITTKGPASLDGHLFSFTGSPNRYGLPPFYELHVWAWRDNPTGDFADMNPDVSCDATVAPAN